MIVFCCCSLLIAICTSCRLEHHKKTRKKVILIYIWNRSAIALYIVESLTEGLNGVVSFTVIG